MARSPMPVEKTLRLLAEAPLRLDLLTSGVAPARLHTASDVDEWSANDVLAHLRACADVWGDCIGAIITEDRPTLRAVSPRSWIAETDYLTQPFETSLRSFTHQRSALMAVLGSLAPDGWRRTATVTGAGRVLERTVLSYAQWLARHEGPHLRQIGRAVDATAPPAP